MDILLISNIEKWHKEVNDKDVQLIIENPLPW